ncbi:MAG: class F sortase [Actinomycetota bacterium]|nr:class F sortase [Actinomycetota bacterium]
MLAAGATAVVRGGEPSDSATRSLSPAAVADHSQTLPVPSGDPVAVRIPAIGVVAPLVPLGLNSDGTLAVPPYEKAGWYAHGRRPGERGPAVIAGHVDSTTGPAVFYRLRELQPGDEVRVEYAGGLTVDFVVRSAGRFPKSAFPTAEVYGPTPFPELRLITCTGMFDRRERSYRDNLVVWADAATAPKAA